MEQPFAFPGPPNRAVVALFLILLALSPLAGADGPPQTAREIKNVARMNCGTRLECIMPDGSHAPMSLRRGAHQSRSVVIMVDDSVSCPLREGDTTFLFSVARATTLDRFNLINENAGARGELRIAVSNTRLPVASEKWTSVGGAVTFSRKRLFNLSLLGVDAKYVKLTFHVEREEGNAAAPSST